MWAGFNHIDAPRLALLVAAALGSLGKTDACDAQQLAVQPVQYSDWTGFGVDFKPQWTGVARRIDYRVGGSSGASVVSALSGVNFDAPPIPTPIGLVSSYRSYNALGSASLRNVTASHGGNIGTPQSGWLSVRRANYGEILNYEDILLTQGAAISEQQSLITDNTIEATGRVAAAAWSHDEVDATGSARAHGGSTLTATYRVTDPVWFGLTGSLAGSGSIDLTASLRNKDTGAALYALSSAADGRRWTFELEGELAPGLYEIDVSAISLAAVEGGGTSSSGLGEFALSFVASPHRLDEWDSRGGPVTRVISSQDGGVDGGNLLMRPREMVNSPTASPLPLVPEPASWTAAMLACLCASAAKRPQRRTSGPGGRASRRPSVQFARFQL